MDNIQEQNSSIFEQIKRIDENGVEYWSARDLSKALDYADYRNFMKVISKAKEQCENSGQSMQYHFVELNDMVQIGSGAKRELDSIKLSRYACYLIALKMDDSKTKKEEAQVYFEQKPVLIAEDKNELRMLTLEDETTNFLLYTTPNGDVKVEAILSNETIWLSQDHMATVFDVQKPAISKHLKNIFEDGELQEDRCISILETHLPDGRVYNVKYYNLDAIISVGYRVNSSRATQFRIWATNALKEYIIKGFVMDDDRLKNGRYFGKDNFEELLERVRSIRASERRIYQKITDIFAECSSDYDPKSEIAHQFYAEVQNKFHFAITGHTAPEIIHMNANANKEFMGLTTWKNAPKGRVLSSDVTVAKNYLKQEEIQELERIIGSYFDYIELQIKRRNTFNMDEFSKSVIKFLEFNDYEILPDKGHISKKQADNKAKKEYESFNKRQRIESDFDRIVKRIEGKDNETK